MCGRDEQSHRATCLDTVEIVDAVCVTGEEARDFGYNCCGSTPYPTRRIGTMNIGNLALDRMAMAAMEHAKEFCEKLVSLSVTEPRQTAARR